MSVGTDQILAEARARADARDAARVPINYAKAKTMFRRQKAALTRAVNSGDVDKIVATVKAAVEEWNQPDIAWPDEWSRWQRALDDALPWNQHVDINDL